MLLEAEASQASRGNVRGAEVETSVLAWPRSKQTAIRYASAIGSALGGEGIVKATRSAEGEGGDAFSLFRLTSEHGRVLLRRAAQVPVPPCRAIIQMSHFLGTGQPRGDAPADREPQPAA
jgi:hypothetical protein